MTKSRPQKIPAAKLMIGSSVVGALGGVTFVQKYVPGGEESMNLTLAGVGGGFIFGLIVAVVIVFLANKNAQD